MSISLAIVLGIVAAVLWLVWDILDSRDRPPGPLRLPLLGTLMQIAFAHPVGFIALDKFSKKYGDVMSIKLGLVDSVILSSYESIKFFYGGDDCLDRPCEGIWKERNFNQNLGLTFSNGAAWAEMRKFTLKTSRQVGFLNRQWMQKLLHEELREFQVRLNEKVSESPDQVLEFSPSGLLKLSFTNIICALLTAERHAYDDKELHDLVIAVEKFLRSSTAGLAIMSAYPALRFIMGKSLGYDAQMESMKGTHQYSHKVLTKRKKLGKYKVGEATCFVDAFLQKMEETQDDPDTLYTEQQLLVIIADYFLAGIETTSSLIQFAILLLMTHPEKQEKLYKEIKLTLGTRMMGIEERNRMVYLQAVILEVHRWGKIAISLAPRQATTDIKYKSFRIKKGTNIVPNMYPVFNDKKYWGDPTTFSPERFIGKDGKLTRMERMIPFGLGKRICVGEQLAKDSSILYLATLIQNYKFQVPEEHYRGKSPSLKLLEGITTCTENFRAKVLKRS